MKVHIFKSKLTQDLNNFGQKWSFFVSPKAKKLIFGTNALPYVTNTIKSIELAELFYKSQGFSNILTWVSDQKCQYLCFCFVCSIYELTFRAQKCIRHFQIKNTLSMSERDTRDDDEKIPSKLNHFDQRFSNCGEGAIRGALESWFNHG